MEAASVGTDTDSTCTLHFVEKSSRDFTYNPTSANTTSPINEPSTIPIHFRTLLIFSSFGKNQRTIP
jgi:hypothetical protein